MTPFQNPEAYEAIVLGTLRSPGVVTLSGHDREKAWDIKAAKGQTGASTTKNGDPIGKFKASFYLVDEVDPETGLTDFDRWEEFQRLLESIVNGPKPTALPIYHPDLALNHFTEVTVGKIGGLVHDGKGGATVTVEFLEYKPPKPKPAAKPAAKPGAAPAAGGVAGPPQRPDPNAAAKAELAALLATARAP